MIDLVPLAGKTGGQAPPACASEEGLCRWLWDRTGIDWLAKLGSWAAVMTPLRIVLIVAIAVLLRWVAHRTISRLTTASANGKIPAILRPLKDRAPDSLRELGLISERREQRAKTIGSVLRSLASVTIFAISGMLILAELGINLAPLLASAGIAGVAIGFGAQNLVKDFLSGMFMMLEDQYGVGDVVNLGEASGTVEAVGFRITTLRDVNGVTWYIRNGEVIRVGNMSQGWAMVNVDVPVPFNTDTNRAVQILQVSADDFAADEEWAKDLLEHPEVLGVQEYTPTGMTLRVTAKTNSSAQWRVGRALRGRLTEALESAGIPSGPTPLLRHAPGLPGQDQNNQGDNGPQST